MTAMRHADTAGRLQGRPPPTWSPERRALLEFRVIQILMGSMVRFLAEEREHSDEEVLRLARELRILRRHLERHFALEESAGFFDEVIEKMPTAEASLDHLRGEHPGFLEETERLADRLEQRRGGEPRKFRRELYGFLKDYLRHESSENEIFQRSLFLDVGVCD